MTPGRTRHAAWAALALVLGVSRAEASPPSQVTVTGARVLVSDVVRGAPADAAGIDLGPAPAVGGSRLIDRATILRALREHAATEPGHLPDAVRVVRLSRAVSATELERLTRAGLDGRPLPRGAALTAVRASRGLDVAAGWDAVTAELPRLPRRAGPVSTTALVTFRAGAEVLGRTSVQVDLLLPASAAAPELARGAPVTLVVRQGLVEIRVGGSAGADADVGDTLPVILRPSGRVLRARLIERETALAEDGP
jgi:hypothetical protein